MEPILKVKLIGKYFNTPDNIKSVHDAMLPIIDKAKELRLWDDSIKLIMVTDDFKNEVEKQAKAWNIQAQISQEKEVVVASKILFNHDIKMPENHLFFHYHVFYNKDFPILEMALSQIFSVKAKKIIPAEIREKKYSYHPASLEDRIIFSSTDWCVASYTKSTIRNMLKESAKPMNHNQFLIAFQRKLKKILFDYNGDKYDSEKRFQIFYEDYFDGLHTLFLRIVENDTEESEFWIKEDEPCRKLIYDVINQIKELKDNCLAGKIYDVSKLKQAIVSFSNYFEVFLEEETSDGFHIRLTKDPKNYFIGALVETEPRIVCFMDILGFSDLINEYDEDITSTLLQDIQESFSLAQTYLLDNKLQKNKDVIRHLKYQTFSDNICISIPYFDNENDFLSNFNLLATYVRGFQLIMMTKGFFTRGGISTGSYYADNNIIFSKGLVNAYLLESKKAIYPRVLVDNIIINKLLSYSVNRVKYFGIDRVIVVDWENISFLNPFGIGESTFSQIDSMLSELNTDDSEPMNNILGSISKVVGDMTIGLLKTTSEHERKNLATIKQSIIENIILHGKNERVGSKYIWLLEFIKWFERDESSKLKFKLLTEKLNEEEF